MAKKLALAIIMISIAQGNALAAANKRLMMSQAIRSNCMSDFKTLCPGMEVGGGRMAKCLTHHKAQVTPLCLKSLTMAGH
jgi:hypothetical protein